MLRMFYKMQILPLGLLLFSAAFAQQNAVLLPWTPQQFTNTNGALLVSGKVCTYLAGTSTGTATFTDATASVQNAIPPNAILLDSTARPTSGGIWLTPNKAYKIITMTAGSDNTCSTGVVVKTQDNVVAQNNGFSVPIVPTTAGGQDLGTTALPWGNLWLGTAATNNFRFQPAVTAAPRILTVPDPLANDTLAFLAATQTFTNKTLTSPTISTSLIQPETVAPSGSGGNDVCYGDSAAHSLKCNYNNTGFSILPLVGIANTWAGNQSFNSGTLLPSAAGGTDLGSTTLPFGNLWLGSSSTSQFKFAPSTTTAARVITIPDPGANSNLTLTPCITSQRTETGADTNLLTCAIPAQAGSYRLRFVMNVSAANAATIGWTATWTDSNGNAQSPTNLLLTQAGSATFALTASNTVDYHGFADVDVNNSGTPIVLKLTFSGTSFTAKVSATVERII